MNLAMKETKPMQYVGVIDHGITSEKDMEYGTPKDVRMFPLKTSMPPGTSSQSIPISRTERSASELRLDQEEALAAYREYLMYQRIKTGLSYKRTDSPRHESSDTMDPEAHQNFPSNLVFSEGKNHILHRPVPWYGSGDSIPTRPNSCGLSDHLPTVTLPPVTGHEDVPWEEDGIFEMDL